MKRVLTGLLLSLVLLAPTRALAAPALCAISGTVTLADGTADKNDTIWFNPMGTVQVINGNTVTAQPVSATTDSSGNLSAISLVQGLAISVTLRNSVSAPQNTFVPISATATFGALMSGLNITPSVPLASLTQPNTGNYNNGAFKITNNGNASGSGDLLVYGQPLTTCATSKWVNALSNLGAGTCTQPAYADISGSSYTVGGLPTCNSGAQGHLAITTDSTNTCVAGNSLTGGGSNICEVVCNGSSWLIVGTVAASGAPSGPAGGDLGSTYPNPTVVASHLASALPLAQGGTAQTAAGAYISNDVTVTSTSISGATTLTLPATGHSSQVLTMTATATITIPQGQWAGQFMATEVCQDGTGGRVPTFAAAGGLTITGTFPTFTTTASKCGDFGLEYTTTTAAYLTGSNGGPL